MSKVEIVCFMPPPPNTRKGGDVGDLLRIISSKMFLEANRKYLSIVKERRKYEGITGCQLVIKRVYKWPIRGYLGSLLMSTAQAVVKSSRSVVVNMTSLKCPEVILHELAHIVLSKRYKKLAPNKKVSVSDLFAGETISRFRTFTLMSTISEAAADFQVFKWCPRALETIYSSTLNEKTVSPIITGDIGSDIMRRVVILRELKRHKQIDKFPPVYYHLVKLTAKFLEEFPVTKRRKVKLSIEEGVKRAWYIVFCSPQVKTVHRLVRSYSKLVRSLLV